MFIYLSLLLINCCRKKQRGVGQIRKELIYGCCVCMTNILWDKKRRNTGNCGTTSALIDRPRGGSCRIGTRKVTALKCRGTFKFTSEQLYSCCRSKEWKDPEHQHTSERRHTVVGKYPCDR